MRGLFIGGQSPQADPAAAGSAVEGRRSFIGRGLVAAAVVVGLRPNSADAAPPVGVRQQFAKIRQHELEHVEYLVDALGDAARPEPTFVNLVQPNLASFVAVAQNLENTGVGAYFGAVPFISQGESGQAILGAAASIALIEARHAGYLNGYRSVPVTQGILGAEQTFETPLTIAQVVGPPGNAGSLVVDLNGGPPPTFVTDPSDPLYRTPENDVAILNFALLLEFLEYQFYLQNVNKFFGV